MPRKASVGEGKADGSVQCEDSGGQEKYAIKHMSDSPLRHLISHILEVNIYNYIPGAFSARGNPHQSVVTSSRMT